MPISCAPNDRARSRPEQLRRDAGGVAQTCMTDWKRDAKQELAGLDHKSLNSLPEREMMICDRQKQFLVNNTAGSQEDHGNFIFIFLTVCSNVQKTFFSFLPALWLMRRTVPNALLIIPELQALGAIEHCRHNKGERII